MREFPKLADVERELILEAVRELGARQAARVLGIGKTTIYRKIHEYTKLQPSVIKTAGNGVDRVE